MDRGGGSGGCHVIDWRWRQKTMAGLTLRVFLPACASEQGNVIGSVRIYIYIYLYIYVYKKKL